MSFMSHLGQLEVRVEQEGLKLYHAAQDWADHLTWDQVRHLLLPAIREVRPDVLAPAAAGASTAEKVEHAAAAAVADGADSGESFEDWARREIGALGRQVAAHSGALGDVVKDVEGLKGAPTKKAAAAAPRAARKSAAPAPQ